MVQMETLAECRDLIHHVCVVKMNYEQLKCTISISNSSCRIMKTLVLRLYLVGAGDMIASAVLLHPRRLPNAPEGVFIQVAPKHNHQGDQIEC